MTEKQDTKARIIDASLTMFSNHGYDTVSIRDIAGAVCIKESSIYYYFKNKRDILETILRQFEARANELTAVLFVNIAAHAPENKISLDWLKTYYFESFLFDPFCNNVMRLMMIEQFHDKTIEKKYIEWMFDQPYQIQTAVLEKLGLAEAGTLFNAIVTRLSFKCLFTGELTRHKKAQFTDELIEKINQLIKGDS